MTGTEKQIIWANSIKEKAQIQVSLVVDELKDKKFTWIDQDLQSDVANKLELYLTETIKEDSASLWIDRKVLANQDLRSSNLLSLFASQVVTEKYGSQEKFDEYQQQQQQASRADRKAKCQNAGCNTAMAIHYCGR